MLILCRGIDRNQSKIADAPRSMANQIRRVGVACASTTGSLIHTWSSFAPTPKSNEGEARAAMEAIQYALSTNTKHLFLQGDAKDITEEILSAEEPQTAALEESFFFFSPVGTTSIRKCTGS